MNFMFVARTISHEWPKRTSKILFLPREHKIHIFKLTGNLFSIILCRHTDDGVFDDFPKISDHFPKISENPLKFARRSHERCRTFFEIFRRLTKISEDCRGLSRNTRRCFDHTPTNFKYNLRDTWYQWNHRYIFTSEDMENTPHESRILFRMNFTSGVFSSKTLVSV